MYKLRIEESSNYKSVYINGKTMRMPIDSTKPVTELNYPEFYDLNITSACNGECPYCYQDFSKGSHYGNVLEKFKKIFDRMDDNQRPFQLAIAGDLHPDFTKLLKLSNDYGIDPNFTTNGMFVETESCDEILKAAELYSNGVAISCHPHLFKYWDKAYNLIKELDNTILNFHHIISDRESIDKMFQISNKYSEVEYHVLLPYMVRGRAESVDLDFDYLFDILKKKVENGESIRKWCFGANFDPYLRNHDVDFLDLSIYEVESMSKYIDLKTDEGEVYKSSFNTEELLCSAMDIGK